MYACMEISKGNMNKENACVEIPAAPEWLSKLERRRERLGHGRLGHEAGAGAPCNNCGDKCPGLDLHFWRKTCRNCKCRKDQHMCTEDNLSGWAQFEILGQIRSKPAYIKIKALANQQVQLDWIPPNAAPDIVSDYMNKLDTSQIPITGSDAATKRKQQLEFQVPPHDLDASLCDNLTESETNQLKLYVQKVRENCVGQGNVVRVGDILHGNLGYASNVQKVISFNPQQLKAIKALHEMPRSIIVDPLIMEMLGSDKIVSALISEPVNLHPTPFTAFSERLTQENMEIIPMEIKQKGKELNTAGINHLSENGRIDDKMLDISKQKNLDVSKDPVLGRPIADFRTEYEASSQFRHQVNSFIDSIIPAKVLDCTPVKRRQDTNEVFNSPIPPMNLIQAKSGAIMKQDTPMRKVKFGVVTNLSDLDLPTDADYEKDIIFAKVVHSEQLKNALQQNSTHWRGKQVVISLSPLSPDFEDNLELSQETKKKLEEIGLNTMALKSGLVNGPHYDKLIEALKDKSVDYKQCKILAPIAELRQELIINKSFQEEVVEYIKKVSKSAQMCISENVSPGTFCSNLTGSQSCDSGFGSKPSTPNYVTHSNSPAIEHSMNANIGKFSTIPGIEDMNMYPEVEPNIDYNKAFDALFLGQPNSSSSSIPNLFLTCSDCLNPITNGEIAVKAERAKKEIAWHPECFKCNKCRELLADLVYFFHNGKVYCGRDLAIILKIPRCKACDELIFTNQYTAAEGATFHIKHFCCYQCDEPLAGEQYIPDEKTNMPLCLKCYDNYFAEACQYCRKPIGPLDQGVAWGAVHWHEPCFICAGQNCGKSLIGGRFCVKNSMPFCSSTCVRSVVN